MLPLGSATATVYVFSGMSPPGNRVFFHYAWGGRLCLHPFNLGFRSALSRDTEIPNLKALRPVALRQGEE